MSKEKDKLIEIVDSDIPNDINTPKKEPKGDETGHSFEEIRMNKIDPAGKIDPATGIKQFLNWQIVKENGEEIQKAVGADGKIYKIVEEKPVKNYKLVIEEPTGELPTTPVDPAPVKGKNLES